VALHDRLTTILGPYEVGEIPEPTDLTVTDADGVPINLTAATAVTFKYAVDGGTTETGTAAVQDAANGVIRITWAAAMTDTAGVLRGRVWYTLAGARPVAARIVCRIVTPAVTIS
jgi:hypothetical protein